jgi:hypothetical protein
LGSRVAARTVSLFALGNREPLRSTTKAYPLGVTWMLSVLASRLASERSKPITPRYSPAMYTGV